MVQPLHVGRIMSDYCILLTVYSPTREEIIVIAMTSMVAPPTPRSIMAPYTLSLDRLNFEIWSSEGSFTHSQILERRGYTCHRPQMICAFSTGEDLALFLRP